MSVVETRDASEQLEVCTVKDILAKRVDQKTRNIEYLVSWIEYPGEDTWERIDNLKNVMNMLDAYENKIK